MGLGSDSLAGLDIARRSVRSSLILFVGNFLEAAFNAVAIILVARLLGPTQYGVYTLALVIPGLLNLFLGLGINTAVIRYSAYYISLGRPEEARRFTINGIYFLWLNGAAFTLLNYVLAGTLSTLLLHRPDLAQYVQLTSLSVFGSMILLTITSTAIGWNSMGLSALSWVAQGVVKLALSPLLIVIGLGVIGALEGHIASYIGAGLLGTSILYVARLRGPTARGSFTADVKEMLRFGLPVYAGGLLAGLATYYVTIILAAIANNTVVGLYQAAANFVLPITLVSTALVNALFPAFASLDGIGGNIQQAFRQAYKFVAFVLTPIILFMVATSGLIIHIFYVPSFSGSAPYLELLALAYLPIAFGYTVHPAFFTGFARPRLTMYVYLGGAITLFICAPLLSIQFGLGVDGLIYATFISYFAAWATGTFLAEKYMHATLDLGANGAILLVSAISCAATILLPKVAFSSVLTLVLDLLVFFGLYLTLAPLAGAIRGTDLDTMEHAFKDLKFVESAFGILLRYERLLISIRE
jgi:stage V sporulation protein B